MKTYIDVHTQKAAYGPLADLDLVFIQGRNETTSISINKKMQGRNENY